MRNISFGLAALAVTALGVAAPVGAAASAVTAATTPAPPPAHEVVIDPKPVAAEGPLISQRSLPTPPPAPLSETFELQSLPGAKRTVYLNFVGGTVAGNVWSDDYNDGKPITVEPFSMNAPVSTAFDDQELAEVQRMWQLVAEDFAPFEVNVTTKNLGKGAIDRTAPEDDLYGTEVWITTDGPVSTNCDCGGIGQIGSLPHVYGHDYLGGAWVFTKDEGTRRPLSKDVGESISHEVGHTFGLRHHGTSTRSYYLGEWPWEPIMGANYSMPVTQWSHGEYPDANNPGQDDVAIIAAASGQEDEFGDTSATAWALDASAPVAGIIQTRTDVDAFRFTAAGNTTVAVTEGPYANLDAQLTILDENGTTVATVDPPVDTINAVEASGLDASWTAVLPSTPATYTALVTGVGSGDPRIEGKYSDYGSLGRYTISLSTESATTDPDPDPVVPDETHPLAFTHPADGKPFLDDGSARITGTGTPGATITVTATGATVGTTTVGADGMWSVQPAAGTLSAGSVTLTATEVDNGVTRTASVDVDVLDASRVPELPLVDARVLAALGVVGLAFAAFLLARRRRAHALG
ncbi:Ig-like domain-containing protein [Leifsonia poae]|uniref:Ig-like domain-containing protein n=1 Tax=Leifsonia poae TaxID=110933 RepID=UPI003D699E94